MRYSSVKYSRVRPSEVGCWLQWQFCMFIVGRLLKQGLALQQSVDPQVVSCTVFFKWINDFLVCSLCLPETINSE